MANKNDWFSELISDLRESREYRREQREELRKSRELMRLCCLVSLAITISTVIPGGLILVAIGAWWWWQKQRHQNNR